MTARIVSFPSRPLPSVDIRDAGEALGFTCDALGRTVSVDPEFERLTGIPLEECMKHDWVAFLHPDDAPHYMRRLYKALAEGRTFNGDTRFRSRYGYYVRLYITLAPVFNDRGQIVKWAGVVAFGAAEFSQLQASAK